jgi:hypothetical protein
LTDYYISPDGSDHHTGAKEAPWQSLHRVKEALQAASRDADVMIHLAAGIHRLNETLVLGPDHGASAGSRVIFKGSDTSDTVISSGYLIEGWKRLVDMPADIHDSLKGRVWYKDLPVGTVVKTLYGPNGSIPRARGKGFRPERLHIETAEDMPDAYGPNGKIDKHERFLNPKARWAHHEFAFNEGDIQPATDFHEAEFFIRPQNPWTMNILAVKQVDFESHLVELAESCTYPIGTFSRHDNTLWLENSLSVLHPGTWVYHASSARLYYCPPGDTPVEGIEAASLTELIRLEGVHEPKGKQRAVENIRFENITFRHSNRFSFHGLTGLGIQHDWEMYDAPSCMLRLRHAKGCEVSHCTFENGGSGGVRIDLASRNNAVESCTFRHLGGVGVLLCGYGPSRQYLNRDNTIADNHIHDIGEAYWHCPGIFVWQSGNNHIARNHIHDLPYTGIVCSGRILYDREGVQECSGTINWDDLEEQCGKDYVYNIWWYSGITDWWKREPLLHSRDNLIEYNHIHDVMLKMGDGNGIYISGAGGGNVIRFNVVGPCPSPQMNEGIRCDDDQHHAIVHGNLIFGLAGDATGITLKGINRVTNNILALPLNPPSRGLLSLETGPLNGSVIQRNIFLTAAPDEKPVSEMRIHGTGRKARLCDTDSDHNLFYCISDPESSARRLLGIQSFGTDANSLSADPMFEDAENGNFRLKDGSPAYQLGFKPLPLDMMSVGYRSAGR